MLIANGLLLLLSSSPCSVHLLIPAAMVIPTVDGIMAALRSGDRRSRSSNPSNRGRSSRSRHRTTSTTAFRLLLLLLQTRIPYDYPDDDHYYHHDYYHYYYSSSSCCCCYC